MGANWVRREGQQKEGQRGNGCECRDHGGIESPTMWWKLG